MCGIWALFGYDAADVQKYASAFKIGHRGADCYHLQNIERVRNCAMAFHRLCVVDNVRGMQVSVTKIEKTLTTAKLAHAPVVDFLLRKVV